jgi:DNA-binding MarR family transcriptional regulator
MSEGRQVTIALTEAQVARVLREASGEAVLAAFPADGTERELSSVANQLSLSPSTTHRYLRTWTAVGLLERDPNSRRYRRSVLGGTAR